MPWIFSGTVKENILFHAKEDKKRLLATCDACSLKKDLESFSDGLDTQLGEAGVNLSGGQKTRIALGNCSCNLLKLVPFIQMLTLFFWMTRSLHWTPRSPGILSGRQL